MTGWWSTSAPSHSHYLSHLFYRYDVDGRLFQVVRNRLSDNYKYYHYIITNSFEDVLQIRDGNGNILAKYNYDNWGKLNTESECVAELMRMYKELTE